MKVWNLAVELFLINSFNYSSFRIRAFLYLLTLNESFSRSGFYLNNLHNFFVLSFNIIDNLAISASTKLSSYFYVIFVSVALFLTNSAYLLSLSYWVLRSLLISKPASSLLISSWTLTESRKLKLLTDSSMRALNLKLSTRFINLFK